MNWRYELPLDRSQGPLFNKPARVASIAEFTVIILRAVCKFQAHVQAADVLGVTFMQALCSCQAGKLNSFFQAKAKPEGELTLNSSRG